MGIKFCLIAIAFYVCICFCKLSAENVKTEDNEDVKTKPIPKEDSSTSVKDKDTVVLKKKDTSLIFEPSNLENSASKRSDEDFIPAKSVEESQKHTAFKPTDEWQAFGNDQILPAGLHVSINLQTGEKLAKLLEKNENSSVEEDDLGAPMKKEKLADDQKWTIKELEKALKSLNINSTNEKMMEEFDESKVNFRTLEELKAEFSAMNFTMKTHSEILKELLIAYQNSSVEYKISILEDLEFLVHQYDVAQDFVKMDGIKLLLPDLNSTNYKIRASVPFTLGSAMQGNPRVQMSVYLSNAMPQLLRLVSFDTVSEVKARALYALSSLIRQFPLAQRKFVEHKGIGVLADLLKHTDSSLKLQMKVVNLIYDLITEHQLTEQYATADNRLQLEKLHLYKSVQLENLLQENGFCSLLPNLLSAPDYDSQERVIKAMLLLANICHESFFLVVDKLHILAENYKSVAAKELAELLKKEDLSGTEKFSDFYIVNLYNSITELITNIEHFQKDEL